MILLESRISNVAGTMLHGSHPVFDSSELGPSVTRNHSLAGQFVNCSLAYRLGTQIALVGRVVHVGQLPTTEPVL
jgi:hypothetical protein